MEVKRFIQKYKFFFLGVTLNAIGLLTLYSALSYKGKVVYEALFAKQLVWMVVSWIVFWVVSSLDYHYWKGVAIPLYLVAIGLLVFVLVAGDVRYGARRWINLGGFVFQPSEFAKMAFLLAISYVMSMGRSLSLKWFSIGLLLTALPVFLVAKEPDLGTAIAFLPITIGVFLGMGLSFRWLIGSGVVGLIMLPVGWQFLKEYQRKRLMVFLNPGLDPLGAGYTVTQSKIAIGSGGIWGKGWLAGTQNKFNFLPERHTDFIFSVLAEEWGLVGSGLVIALFGYLIHSCLVVAGKTEDPFGRYLAIAVGMYFFFHSFVNISMTCGFMPVVGLPLPFMSYGGTSLLMSYFALGLVQSISNAIQR